MTGRVFRGVGLRGGGVKRAEVGREGGRGRVHWVSSKGSLGAVVVVGWVEGWGWRDGGEESFWRLGSGGVVVVVEVAEARCMNCGEGVSGGLDW